MHGKGTSGEAEDSAALLEISALLRTAASPAALSAAGAKLQQHLQANPADPTALHLLGRVYFALASYENAEETFRKVLSRSPDHLSARWMLALTLHRRVDWEGALREVEALLCNNPEDSDYLNFKAELLLQTGEYDAAAACYGTLLSKHPTAENWLYCGHALRARGRMEESVAAYRKAVSLDPGFGEAYWSLANLKTFRFAPSETLAMQSLLEQPGLEPRPRAALHFALGKALEDLKEYEPSFREYEKGNAVWRQQLSYNPNSTAAFVRRCKTVFTPDFFRERSGAGMPASDPIFIVSLPRSGSTLVEQILASHPAIEGTRELPLVTSLAERLSRKARAQYPEAVRSLLAEDLRWAGEEYLARAQLHRKTGKPFFLDKMTGNFLHLGLLQLILPNAKIIDVRRHPLASGFANYRHFYLQGAPFAFDLEEMGRYYRHYVELMAHFDAVLPGRVHRIFYEDLVASPEREIRKLLDYCGLPFDESCLRFYMTDRGVLTPSAAQVRQPIYSTAVEQWRNYERWLGPMQAALGDVLTGYPAVPNFGGLPAASDAQWRMSTEIRFASPPG